MQEKAYKILALQENISNREAKDLIDKGCVFASGRKVTIARALMNHKTKFNILKIVEPKVIFEDDKIIAINKPYAYISEDLEKKFCAKLLNRIDKETSGVVLLCKDENFRKLCIDEFKKQRVYKSYLAILDGILAEEVEVNEPILTIKTHKGALSKISREGLNASSIFIPIMVQAKKTLAKVIIKTGRTHQIRVHAKFIKHAIIGDEKYAKISSNRMYLHSYEIQIFDYKFKAELENNFSQFGFELKSLDF
ncbi:pseudouridine synthase family protein [Campylobacter estrildidarum]|uniref:RNA pseudouridylate synthase n=1 Tax=Campylobacter estrildidarum TaxID=2510189 RepID=A0A4U7BI34_9BACT|nr:RluA family pseudouridine synthase [Campylobacter estrildidarum]TKX29981.1 RNA pseudouridine synthase [Campylobacter estrildidarum]